MAARKRKSRSRSRGKRAGGGILQKFLVALSGVVLVLCGASVTYGLFVGGSGKSGTALQLQILNGTGQSGLAHTAKRALLERGVGVIEVGNAETFDYEESILVVRRKGAEVRRLAEVIGCGNVIEQLQDNALEDATLILGNDYEALRLDLGRGSGL